jgi:proline racemase/trans-L-3-hydroxyproline dehydratase
MGIASVRTIDYHTGGEPFRIVPDPPVDMPGDNVADRRARAVASDDVQLLRQILCFEPRGHADMYGGLITPPDDEGAHFGALFWHKDGFSTACGHGTIALGAWAVSSGLVGDIQQEEVVDVVVDVPSGRVTARVHAEHGVVGDVDFVSVPSYVIAQDVPVETGRGHVRVDVAYGGAIYAQVRAADLGLAVKADSLQQLIAAAREVKRALTDSPLARHDEDDRLSGIYGTILYDDLGRDPDGSLRQRNVTVFADGEVDRSPCGSGTASRVALLAETGRLADGQRLVHESIVGSEFCARVEQKVGAAGRPAVVPVITGRAHQTGEHVFMVDPHDPLVPGFVLR